MKLHLPTSLRTSLLATLSLCATGLAHGNSAADTLGADWQNTAYIGDSITHGYTAGSRSYRWQLFKILVDNGISQTEVGIRTGYNSGASNIMYGGASFDNLHSAQSGIKASQIAGETSDSSYLGGTNIQDWLGIDTSYTGQYKMHDASGAAAVPDTAFVMMGSNDILHCEGGKGMTSTNVETLAANATRYLDTVVNSLQQVNADMNIIVTTLPTWSQDLTDRNGKNADPTLLATYNAAISTWASEKEGVTLVDVNRGIIDVARPAEQNGYAVTSMYVAKDGVHPSAQGDLIIASNIAQQLGYAGRTAGQERVDADAFEHQSADIFAASSHSNVSSAGETLVLADSATLCYEWAEGEDLSSGFTVDFNLASGLGNGATDGWNTESNFSLSVGDGTHAGTLNVNEAYIQWGSDILYSIDTSQLTENLRVAYVYGNSSAEQGLSSGFYVWLGDMLIGEALSSTGTSNELSLTNSTGTGLTLGHLSLTAGAYAPTSTLFYNTNTLIEPPEQAATQSVTLTGQQFWNGPGANVRKCSGVTSGNVNIIVEGTNTLGTEWLVINNGEESYEGDIDVTLKGNMTHNSAGNKYNVLQYLGTLNGSISLTVADGFQETNGKAWGGFQGTHGNSNAYSNVTGDVSMTFSSSDLTITPHSGAWLKCAIAGIGRYGKIDGAVNISITAGTINGDIYGGVYSSGGSIGQGTHVTLTGGVVSGNVYGGGAVGTIAGGTAVTVSGGATVTGDIICAGGTGGTITGGTTLPLSEIDKNSAFARSFKGTLSGGNSGVTGERSLVLKAVKLATLSATVENVDCINVEGKSDVGLSSLGGAEKLNVDKDSRLVLTGGTNKATVTNDGTLVVQTGAALRLSEVNADANASGTYELRGGELTVGGYQNLESNFLICSGTFTMENATNLGGRLDIVADGTVELSHVAMQEITRLETTHADASVSGLEGMLQLEEVVATLGLSSVEESGAAFLFSTQGGLDIGTLTLNLDADLSAALVQQATGDAVGYAVASSLPAYVVSNGTLNAEHININLASGYEGYVAQVTGVSAADGSINYTVTQAGSGAVPEPSTATLSLLALAALSARRRRR